MSITNPERTASGSPNLDSTVLAPATRMAKCRRQHVIAKMLVGGAIALCSGIAGAASVSADPNPVNTGPNPYGTLSCECRETTPADSPALQAEIDRGLREGHSAWLPGLPAPARPSQPRS